MSSVNKVILVGHLGKDPKVTTMNSGDRIVSFTLATSESWKDKNTGERREKTEWHNVTIFNEGIGSVAEKYLKKGSKVYLEGKLQTRKYNDQNGQERYTTEVVLQQFRGELVLLDRRDDGERGETAERSGDRRNNRSSASDRKPPSTQTRDEDFNDDIPF